MLTCRLRVLTRELIDFAVVAILGLVLLLSLTGCMVQPVDAQTGENVGGPVSRLDAPATNPANGNPVVLKNTDKVDVDRVVEQGGATLQGVLVEFGPWGLVAAGAIGLGVKQFRGRRKKQ